MNDGSHLPAYFVVAIDGPAASGKSTVGEIVADRLDAICFDTGLLYRAVTWAVQQLSVNVDDPAAVATVAQNLDFNVRPGTCDDGRKLDIIVNGEDVTWKLRELGADNGLSTISAYPEVRLALLNQQRSIATESRIVMLGRDIGTVVVPDAEIKIFLSASLEERARRRLLDHLDRGDDISYEAVLDQVRRRDEVDSTRAAAPLRPALDAVQVDSDGLTQTETAELILEIVNRSLKIT